MPPRRTTTRVAVALLVTVLLALTVNACDLVDETTTDDTRPDQGQVHPDHFGGRALVVLQPARVIGLTSTSNTCRVDTDIACSVDGTQTYQLLGGPSRVALLNAKVVRSDDGSWGVQARFARESRSTLESSRQRALQDGTLLLVIGNGNRALLAVPTESFEDIAGRLVTTSGGTEKAARAVIASLNG